MKTLKDVFAKGLVIVEFVSCTIMMFGCLGNSVVKDYMIVAAWVYMAVILISFGFVAGGGDKK